MGSEKPRKRIWVQHVAVDAEALQTRINAARVRGLDPTQEAIAVGIGEHIRKARDAALRDDPIPGRWANWWRGTLVEAAYRNIHAARAQAIDLYEEHELQAEIPVAVARAQVTLHRADPRQVPVEELRLEPVERLRPRLRRLMDDSYESLDRQHGQLRSFRNILLLAALVITVLVATTLFVVAQRPTVMPLCFPNEVVTDTDPTISEVDGQNCPTRSRTDGPSGGDILIVALLGGLGGALAASVSIRNLKGTSTPYDVPVALAMLKFPLGAFTAILALVAIQGDFVPGLTVLDSQEQILAYALVFGFGQQVFTRLLDQRAQSLLEGLPGDPTTEPPRAPAGTPGAQTTAGADRHGDALVISPREPDDDAEPDYLPNPQGDDEGQVQDDATVTLPDAPDVDYR